MSLSERFPTAILETILSRLASLFLAGAAGDARAARHAAAQMLAAYKPQTGEELSLAASIIGFDFQALEALAQAADPNLPVTRILRLRSGAVSLSREAGKARKQLSQLQKARQPVQPTQPEQAEPSQARPVQPQPQPAPAKPPARIQTEAQQQEDLRIAASLKRAEARVAALAANPNPSHQPQHPG